MAGLFSRKEKAEGQEGGYEKEQQYPQEPPPPFDASRSPPMGSPPPFQSNFASMSLHSSDLIRLLGFPFETQALVRNVVATSWPRGIQGERPYHGAYEFKLKGYPWASSLHEAVTARRLLMRVLANMHSAGWMLSLTADISKAVSDCDTLIFRHQIPAPAPCQWLCISFSRSDRLRLIDAPTDLTEAVVARLMGAGALQSRKDHDVPGCHELKMMGYPWLASYGADTMKARSIVLMLLSVLEMHGWTVYASLDQKSEAGGESASGDSDTWHCCRPVGWTPGQPVWHH